uniref:Polygalacturonase n=1 Tax=Cajanus cajan TaxID=3821 RepID=A0A151S1Y0_CAJCA|nr:Polygalacturonase [Cajanus cajan]
MQVQPLHNNVVNFGAKADGKSDCTKAFLKAWESACTSQSPATIYVPKGRYLLRNTNFRGPCKRKVTFLIDGTLVAPEDYRALGNSGYWILFNHVENIVVSGGKLDAKGAAFWNCRRSGKGLPRWSKGMYMCAIFPMPMLLFLFINYKKLSNIGSLGKEMKEQGVENVTLTNAIFSGSDSGVRIKTWARPSKGFVRNVTFQNIIMDNVENPIIIDQNYCPNNQGCPGQTSGIKSSQITYSNMNGTSATPEAVTFDCSPSSPCQGIKLQDINLNFNDKIATSSCKNIEETSSGTLVPESCL